MVLWTLFFHIHAGSPLVHKAREWEWPALCNATYVCMLNRMNRMGRNRPGYTRRYPMCKGTKFLNRGYLNVPVAKKARIENRDCDHRSIRRSTKRKSYGWLSQQGQLQELLYDTKIANHPTRRSPSNFGFSLPTKIEWLISAATGGNDSESQYTAIDSNSKLF